jgi:hypothetical protein
MNEPQLSEDEIRQLQAELDRISVDDVLIQTVVTLLNVGARKSGLGDPDAPVDLEQTRLAIDGARALIPLLEERHGEQLGPVKDMVSQLQVAYAQKSGGAAGAPEGAPAPAAEQAPTDRPGGSSGRLWVPGQ